MKSQTKNQVDVLQEQVYQLQENQAFASESILELEKTSAKQHLEIKQLEKQIKILSEYVKTLKQEGIKDVRDETPPPHY